MMTGGAHHPHTLLMHFPPSIASIPPSLPSPPSLPLPSVPTLALHSKLRSAPTPRENLRMSFTHFHARADSPTVDLVVDMGNPILNSTVNGFLKVAPVGATHAATKEAFKMFQKESVSKRDLEAMVKKAAHEGLQWGLVAGIYSGVEYGIHRVRGRRDWKNAMVGGALTGAILTMGDKHFDKNRMIQTAITGGAIATANELLRYV